MISNYLLCQLVCAKESRDCGEAGARENTEGQGEHCTNSIHFATLPVQQLQKSGIEWILDPLEVRKFKQELECLVSILEPIACAVKCLKSTLTNAVDVYQFWLAILATLSDLFRGQDPYKPRFLESTINDIHQLVNAHWKQCTDGLEHCVYLATLFLDLCKCSWSLILSSGVLIYQADHLKSLIFMQKSHNPLNMSI